MPDSHTPTAEVIGNSIVCDADSALFTDGYVPEFPPSVGTIIGGGNNLAAETRAPEGIRWDNMPPGNYELTIFGRPDDYMNPDRQKAVVALTVLEPTRLQRIDEAVEAVLKSRHEMAVADMMLASLNPTPQELAQVL